MPPEKDMPDAQGNEEIALHEDPIESGDEEAGQDAEDSPDEVGDAEGDAGPVDGEPPRRSRAETRIQRLREEVAEAKREAADARRRTEEFAASQRSAVPAGETQEQRAQRYALMTSDERVEARLSEATHEFNQRLGLMQFQSMEAGDKAAFKALCVGDPVAAKYSAEVESRLTEMRRQGQNVDRERLLTYIIGEKTRARARDAGEKAKKDGARRVERQTTRPANNRGDQPATRQPANDAAARRKRLENVIL